MESARYGRTRYLAVVSCARKHAQRKSTQSQQQQPQQQQQLINAQNIINSKGISSSTARNGNNNEQQHQNSHGDSTPSPHRKSVVLLDHHPGATVSSATILSATLKSSSKHLINEKDLTNLSRLSTSPKHDEKYLQQQPLQPQQTEPQSDEMNPNQPNEVEESCLLGIDCNEKTTVGLVLRILGDTTIRLDGDG